MPHESGDSVAAVKQMPSALEWTELKAHQAEYRVALTNRDDQGRVLHEGERATHHRSAKGRYLFYFRIQSQC